MPSGDRPRAGARPDPGQPPSRHGDDRRSAAEDGRRDSRRVVRRRVGQGMRLAAGLVPSGHVLQYLERRQAGRPRPTRRRAPRHDRGGRRAGPRAIVESGHRGVDPGQRGGGLPVSHQPRSVLPDTV